MGVYRVRGSKVVESQMFYLDTSEILKFLANNIMKTFIVIYRPGSSWIEGKPISEQPLQEHGKIHGRPLSIWEATLCRAVRG